MGILRTQQPRLPRVLRPTPSQRRHPQQSPTRPRQPTRRHPPRLPPTRHPLQRTHRLGTPTTTSRLTPTTRGMSKNQQIEGNSARAVIEMTPTTASRDAHVWALLWLVASATPNLEVRSHTFTTT